MVVRVRSCFLREVDVRGDTGRLRIHEPLMSCATFAEEVTLAPGESTASLELTGIATPGSWDLVVRHALDPELWTPVTVSSGP